MILEHMSQFTHHIHFSEITHEIREVGVWRCNFLGLYHTIHFINAVNCIVFWNRLSAPAGIITVEISNKKQTLDDCRHGMKIADMR
jgi:hypothetical protein